MEWDAYQNLLDMERERRKTPRERELEKVMAEIGMKHQRALQAELAPFIQELAEIESKKPPLPVLFEGKLFEWRGPLPSAAT